MRKPIFYLCSLAVISACENNSTNTDAAAGISDSMAIIQDKTAVAEKSDTAQIAAEVKMYKERMANRISEYDEEISKLTKEWEAEKDKVKKDQYGETIKSREERRRQLQERLDKIGENMNEDWKEFKEEVQRFFEEEPSGK